MGSSFSRNAPPPPTPPSQILPTAARSELASAVVDRLLDELRPILTPDSGDEERECYEVSRLLRYHERTLHRAVADLVPGSSLLPRGHRVTLATKMVMVFINVIDQEIVRPGPVAEDRHGSDMVYEAAQLRERLADLIGEVISVDDRERSLPPPPPIRTQPLASQRLLAAVDAQLATGSTAVKKVT